MISSGDILNITKVWTECMERLKLELFCIPCTVITLTTLVINPILLICIFGSRALRRETRYLLVANTLIADILFLIVNLIILVCNTVRAPMPWSICELLTAVNVTAYSCAILTVTLMVADTFAAVRWPLRYHNLLTPAGTFGILLGVWVLAALYPFTSMIVERYKIGSSNEAVSVCLALISLGLIQLEIARIHVFFFVAALICTFLIFYCYIRLYMITRTQGIWQSRFSRARVTVLAHGVLLLLYFAPGFVFILELFMFEHNTISQDVRVWVSTVNTSVLMLLPRAFAPYLYGLRYRDIADSVTLLLHCNRRLSHITLT
ncbi:probable G-protein coupled receptor 148 [Cololabis saira]|uniref:probable G-protein coupled receptor 148 n=1 Tax=Cololabis saira TaxID=129043 RepID=UPI002AD4EC02|nr:probable G-protein coupled receptor 148 [Cololabis saira]